MVEFFQLKFPYSRRSTGLDRHGLNVGGDPFHNLKLYHFVSKNYRDFKYFHPFYSF